LFGSRPRAASSASGLFLGAFAFVGCLGATALAGRRRLRKLKLGSLQRWTQVHIAVGALGFFAALLHANFAIHGWLTATLLLIFGGVFLSGFIGQTIYTLVPPLITRIEGEKSMLVEDVRNEQVQLQQELAALTESAAMQAVAARARALAGGLLARTRKDYHPDRFAEDAQADQKVEHLLQQLPLEKRGDARRVVADVLRIRDCKIQLALYRLLKVWLALHISATAVLLTLMFLHVGAVLWWFR
jgi:hypothetical protein